MFFFHGVNNIRSFDSISGAVLKYVMVLFFLYVLWDTKGFDRKNDSVFKKKYIKNIYFFFA